MGNKINLKTILHYLDEQLRDIHNCAPIPDENSNLMISGMEDIVKHYDSHEKIRNIKLKTARIELITDNAYSVNLGFETDYLVPKGIKTYSDLVEETVDLSCGIDKPKDGKLIVKGRVNDLTIEGETKSWLPEHWHISGLTRRDQDHFMKFEADTPIFGQNRVTMGYVCAYNFFGNDSKIRVSFKFNPKSDD